MIYKWNDAPKYTDLWAFAYQVSSNGKRLISNRSPVLGKIETDRCFHEKFIRGDGYSINGVSYMNRTYSDSEEEAKKAYNDLVKQQIQIHSDFIKMHKRSVF